MQQTQASAEIAAQALALSKKVGEIVKTIKYIPPVSVVEPAGSAITSGVIPIAPGGIKNG